MSIKALVKDHAQRRAADPFRPGAPAKLHAPGRPWHKTRVRLRFKRSENEWAVSVRGWSRSAHRERPGVGEIHFVSVETSQLRLLPTKRRFFESESGSFWAANAGQPGKGSAT